MGVVIRFHGVRPHDLSASKKQKRGRDECREEKFRSCQQRPPLDQPEHLFAPNAKPSPYSRAARARGRSASSGDFSEGSGAWSCGSKLHNSQRLSSGELHNALTTELKEVHYAPGMDRIHKGKQPNRPHFIREWAEFRGYKTQAELAEALEADKSVVSRWYNGTSPTKEWQTSLAALFHCDRESLFRHPDDDWIAKFFRDRSQDEIARMRQMLEAAFPVKTKKAG